MSLRYFHPSEFACKCGCEQNLINPMFLVDLDNLRHECGFPFIISSGYRCPEHNAKVSSTGRTGPHTTGRAADIVVRGQQAMQLLRGALKRGFTGIGVNQKGGGRFIHLDTLTNSVTSPRPTIWSY